MSTNAYIQVEGSDLAVLKYWDGYPSATMPWLRSFHEMFLKERGVDPHYETAQLLRSSHRDAEKFDLDNKDVTGWGIYHIPDLDNNGDCDFNYILMKNGNIKINGVEYTPDDSIPED